MLFLASDHAGFALAKQIWQLWNISDNFGNKLNSFKNNLEDQNSLTFLTPELVIGDDYPDIAGILAHELEIFLAPENLEIPIQTSLINSKIPQTQSKTELQNFSKISQNTQIPKFQTKNHQMEKILKNHQSKSEIQKLETDQKQNFELKNTKIYQKTEKEICHEAKICQTENWQNNPTQNNFGLAICGTGIGISIALNRFKFIRAGCLSFVTLANLAENLEIVAKMRQHNDANVLCLGSTIKPKIAIRLWQKFVQTPFSRELRHQKRIQKLSKLEFQIENIKVKNVEK